ncbi:hypothetical protein FOCC_FOCC013843 [Frankliniella occidentalis]|uniref:Poly [ADP-ribose] polymerase n=1 Tax=Frankliniella occidentalis TaxID=133901 RepID=A0A6J1SFL1_FRAOC|nr:uncharacterized protein LOC113207433 [Frankliniella occidentalis]KAE8740644.1 hypothetical protein FOCC_FOCC013843 [Frankliniella occidentalis]
MAVVERTTLTPDANDYQVVSDLFYKTNNCLTIQSIEAVKNDNLELKFKDKQEEYKDTYGEVRVVKVWHGTKSRNVDSILENNFDVSRHGQNRGHRFGAGVSFSAITFYASHYCDEDEDLRSMLLCEVLVSNIVEVPETKGRMPPQPPFLPGRHPLRYDTLAKDKEKMDVIVKMDANAFRPTHVVNFKKTGCRRFSWSWLDDSDDDDSDYGF